MQDMDVREALHAHVREHEPPMGLTLGAIRSAARRSRRTRRAAALASAVVAGGLVVAVVAQGGWLPFDRGSGPFQALAPCAADPGSRPAGRVSESQPPTEEHLSWARAQLTCFLATVMPTLLPNATYARVPGAKAGPLVGFSHEPGMARVDALALVRDAAGTGDMLVIVGVVDPSIAAEAAEECRNSSICTLSTGPEGETIVLNQALADANGGFKDINAWVYRGHTVVTVEVSNSDRESVDGAAPAAKRPEPVLSAEQVVALARSEELYLFP
jgi:hypothetical protein